MGQNASMNVNPRLTRLLFLQRGWFGAAVSLGIISGALILLQAYVLSMVINRVFLEGAGLRDVMTSLAAMAGIILLRSVCRWAGDVSAVRVGSLVIEDLRHKLLAKLYKLGPEYLDQYDSSVLVMTAFEGLDALDKYFSQYLPQLILAMVIPLGTLLVVFPMDAITGFILLFTAPLIPVFMVLIGKTGEQATRKQWTALARMTGFFTDIIRGLPAIKALGQIQNITGRIQRTGDKYRQATMSILRITFLSALVLEWVVTLSTAVVAVQVGLRLLSGNMTFLPGFFLLVIAPEFYQPLRQLGVRFHAGMAGMQAAGYIFQVLDASESQKTSSLISIVQAPHTVVFEQVSFRYADREVDAVNSITFELTAGKMTALVGESGSGKSTIASLLMGFLQPNSGCILIDGIRLSELSSDAWRRQIAWVPQRVGIFAGSIEDNLRIAKLEATDEEIHQALQTSQLLEVIRQLPEGLRTRIGEGGLGLSGGQLQRLALARAFLKDAPLLVLDEPTAHLDPESDSILMESLELLTKDRMTLMIAHRLRSVQKADEILVLSHGRIVERGTHASLVEQAVAYKSLVTAGGEAR